LRLGKDNPDMLITSKQHDFKGNVNTVISHRQHVGKTFPNIFAQDTNLQSWIQNTRAMYASMVFIKISHIK
jgi:hypothetical protein